MDKTCTPTGANVISFLRTAYQKNAQKFWKELLRIPTKKGYVSSL
jgi:hypothetical protein